MSGLLVVAHQVLLVSRELEGCEVWAPPGGKVKPGEDMKCALRREMVEETGLDVEISRAVACLELHDPSRHVLIYSFWLRPCLRYLVEACPDGDALKLAWVGQEKMPFLHLAPGVRQLFNRIGL